MNNTIEKLPYLPDLDHASGGRVIMLIKTIGFLAALTSTISLVPQIIQSFKTKSVSDLSIWMLWNFLFSSILWCFYGAMILSFAVIGTNLIMTLFSMWLIILKFKYE